MTQEDIRYLGVSNNEDGLLVLKKRRELVSLDYGVVVYSNGVLFLILNEKYSHLLLSIVELIKKEYGVPLSYIISVDDYI